MNTLRKPLMFLSLIGAAVFGLSACNTMTVAQCQAIDPAKTGLTDGQNGLASRQLDELLSSCAGQAGAIADIAQFKNQYLSAYQKGLVSYCEPKNGERIGLLGQSYQGVCPKETEAAFMKEYLYAKKQYQDAHPETTRPYIYDPYFDPWYDRWGYPYVRGPFWRGHFYRGW